MKYILWSVVILSTFTFSSCEFPSILSRDTQASDSEKENQTKNLLFVEITGGIAGINQRLVVDDLGRALFVDSFQPGAKWVVQLLSSDLDSLKSLFLDNNFFQLNREYIGQVADAFFYAISFTHNNLSKTVTTDYFGAPDNLRRIVDGLLLLKSSITNNGLDLKLEMSRHEIHVGETVDLKLMVTNISDKPLTLHFSSGQIFDFYALHDVYYPNPIDNDSLIWNWAHDKVFIMILLQLQLRAGETRSYEIKWDGRDNSGNFVSGEVIIAAELVSVPGGRPEQQKLVINK